ncbi:MAG: type II toxin-antitoxin system RelE/ParE family toxin [Gemmatimonadales bacterium]|nr:type II toxin-antitoxin system RelE/ParE family toxin [Gemmatimonadales bacterium]
MRSLIVRVRARADIDEAFEWYRARSPGAASDFLDAIDQALTQIAEAPERFPVVRGRVRRRLLVGFPYAVYYKLFPDTISVVGVIHGHRHPDTWLERAAP